MKVYKIVLTGGPCAGKTESIKYVCKELKKEGYKVIPLPETASEWINIGVVPEDYREHILMFQELMFNMQTAKEKSAEAYAEFHKKEQDIVIIYDRSIMDNRAYMSGEDYENMLLRHNCSEISMLDKYDLVLNLISLASCMKDKYELNETRSENPNKASSLDTLTSFAWSLHRNIKIIKPTDTIKEKQELILKYIKNLINACQIKETDYFKVDIENSDLSYFNKDNSKTMKEREIKLEVPSEGDYIYTLRKKNYNGQTSYVYEKKYQGILKESKPITQEKYLEIITTNKYQIIDLTDKKVTSFIHNYNHYKLIEQNKEFFIECERQHINDLPSNIKLVPTKNKTLTKKKNVVL